MQGLMQDYPLTLPHIFHRAEQLFPTKSIVTATATGLDRTTYSLWADRTRRLAGALDALGVGGDGRVGTFAWNSARHLELYFAVPCSGRVLHALNIRLFPEQLLYVVNHAQDEVIFVDRSLIASLWTLADKLETVKHFIVMDDGKGDVPDDPRIIQYETLIDDARPAEFDVSDEGRAAAMCYTSGTTGNPKGAVYSHRSMFLHSLGVMLADTLGISESDVLLPVVPMFHVNAWGLPHAGVFAGASFVFPGPRMSPDAITDLLATEKVTITAGVPTIWMGVMPLLEGRDMSALRTVVCGGSAVSRGLSEGFREAIGRPMLQAWGMTETSPIGSVCRVKSTVGALSDDELADLRTKQGLPAPCVDVRIAHPVSGQELQWDGTVFGELQVRGPWIAGAYYNDDRSSESFTSDGWLRTRDVATIDSEGYIGIVDRTGDLIKSGGEWISSVELENAIMAHPQVAEASVIGVSHPRWDERPLACVVVKEGEDVTKEEIIDFLRKRVAKLWLPDDVVFVDDIPKTSVGKFSKKDLRERFADYELPTAQA